MATVKECGMANEIFDKKTAVSMLALIALFCGISVSGAGVGVLEEAPPTWHLPDGATARLGKGAIGSGNRAVALSSDGRTLAVASGIGVWLYDGATARTLALLPSSGRVNSVSFSPDGGTLATVSEDGTVLLWDVVTRSEAATLDVSAGRVTSVVFSPEGDMLAAASEDGAVQLWDAASRSQTATLEGHSDNVNSVVFSPDGGTLATASEDGTVLLWDVSTRTQAGTLEGLADDVTSLSFSQDGGTLATVSGDSTVLL